MSFLPETARDKAARNAERIRESSNTDLAINREQELMNQIEFEAQKAKTIRLMEEWVNQVTDHHGILKRDERILADDFIDRVNIIIGFMRTAKDSKDCEILIRQFNPLSKAVTESGIIHRLQKALKAKRQKALDMERQQSIDYDDNDEYDEYEDDDSDTYNVQAIKDEQLLKINAIRRTIGTGNSHMSGWALQAIVANRAALDNLERRLATCTDGEDLTQVMGEIESANQAVLRSRAAIDAQQIQNQYVLVDNYPGPGPLNHRLLKGQVEPEPEPELEWITCKSGRHRLFTPRAEYEIAACDANGFRKYNARAVPICGNPKCNVAVTNAMIAQGYQSGELRLWDL
jgi:hypothetical protein